MSDLSLEEQFLEREIIKLADELGEEAGPIVNSLARIKQNLSQLLHCEDGRAKLLNINRALTSAHMHIRLGNVLLQGEDLSREKIAEIHNEGALSLASRMVQGEEEGLLDQDKRRLEHEQSFEIEDLLARTVMDVLFCLRAEGKGVMHPAYEGTKCYVHGFRKNRFQGLPQLEKSLRREANRGWILRTIKRSMKRGSDSSVSSATTG